MKRLYELSAILTAELQCIGLEPVMTVFRELGNDPDGGEGTLSKMGMPTDNQMAKDAGLEGVESLEMTCRTKSGGELFLCVYATLDYEVSIDSSKGTDVEAAALIARLEARGTPTYWIFPPVPAVSA